MIENIMKFFKKANKREALNASSKETAKERLHLVLMQDRANVSADFLDLMRQEIIEVIKKYIDIDETAMDVRLTNQENEDGTQGAPALYANIPIINIKETTRTMKNEEKKEEKTENDKEIKEKKQEEMKKDHKPKNYMQKEHHQKNNNEKKEVQHNENSNKEKQEVQHNENSNKEKQTKKVENQKTTNKKENIKKESEDE